MKFNTIITTELRSQISGLDVIFAPIADMQIHLSGFRGLVEVLVDH